ncbi:lipopolysaccharide biosynthesis protein [Vibrio alginolyticus]|uniref:lipopolysaccharide biosynthesis protein n=1 Tax=Vibrio alginolyticus TaxID=663 RepID=UPI002875FC11|nr:hypothetical protein [Vibrio alginolyticus]ELE6589756.1 hypothetical protein [Vibrio alginolyticus]
MNKLLKNTLYLTTKLLLTTIITLCSIRFLLQSLGAEDYGLLNLIAGTISLLSFLNGAMAISTQRNITYSFNSHEQVKIVFSNAILIHAVLATVLVLLCLIIKPLLFQFVLNIPLGKVEQAGYLYWSLLVAIFFSILSVPNDAMITANEEFGVATVIGVFDAVLKLLIAFTLTLIEKEHLLYYSILLSISSTLIYICKFYYCKFSYESAVFLWQGVNKYQLSKLTGFAGWNTFGALCGVARLQGFAILINLFFTLVTNAAYAISIQVNSKLKEFSLTVTKAFNPQIVKLESKGHREDMLVLSMKSSKISLYLFALLSIPLVINIEGVFFLWLGKTPDEAIIFTKLFFILSAVNLTTVGLQSAIQAIGKIKYYQMAIGGMLLLTIPVSYCVFSYGFPSYSMMVVSIVFEVFSCLLRLYFLNKEGGLKVASYCKEITKALIILIIVYITISSVFTVCKFALLYSIILSILGSSVFLVILIYLYGIDNYERKYIKEMLKRCIHEKN